MKRTEIRRLNNKQDILKVLACFTDRFLSLSRGEEYCRALAEKYEKNAEFLTLCSDGKLAAFAAFYCNDEITKEAFLSLIGVTKGLEGKGFGGMMLDEVIAVSGGKGMKSLSLEVKKINGRAVLMYQKRGFEVVDEKTNGMLVMRRDL